MRVILCSLVFLAALGVSSGIELPLCLDWDSHNELSYLPSQTGKEYNWREFYRIGIGLDSLSLANFKASFLLQSRADFVVNQIELKEFRLGYQLGELELTAASLPFGYGRLNKLNPLPRISANMDDYRYQATRFNGLWLTYRGFAILAGGNQLNQSMLTLGYQGGFRDAGISYEVAQEGRVKDSHWNTPAAISSAAVHYHQPKLQLSCSSAYSRFFRYEKTPAHNSFYLLGQMHFIPFEKLALQACAEYHEHEPSAWITKVVDSSFTASFGHISLSPGYRFDYLAGDRFSTLYLAADWLFRPDQRIGLLYRCEKLNEPIHILGLQARLNYRP